MSEIIIGTNWQRSLIDRISVLNRQIGEQNHLKVAEVFGSIPFDAFGSAREASRLPACDYDSVSEHVKVCHDAGIRVTYANNSLCIGSINNIDQKLDQFGEHISRLRRLGVDAIIFANPLYIEYCKTHFQDMPIIVSSIAGVDSVSRLHHYKQQGVDRVIVAKSANRNFQLLYFMKKVFGELELIMTDGCLKECPYQQSHLAMQAHESVDPREDCEHYELQHYPYHKCWSLLTENWPAEFLKVGWIRPEDIEQYEKIGYDKFKISGRTMPEEWIVNTAKAYISREYHGDLLDLIPVTPRGFRSDACRGQLTFSLPNDKLNGFIKHFVDSINLCDESCRIRCGYCDDYAKKLK
jgi:putative protease